MPFFPIESKLMWFWNFVNFFIRFWGILTATVLCGVGIDIVLHYHLNGIYVIAASFIVLLLEINWIFSHCVRLFPRKDNRITNVWYLVKIKHWQKSVLYLPLCVAIVIKSYRLWLSSVAGVMLLILSCLHVLVCFRDQKNAGKRTLLLSEEDYQERNEEVIFEILDNSIGSKGEMSVEEPGGHVLDI